MNLILSNLIDFNVSSRLYVSKLLENKFTYPIPRSIYDKTSITEDLLLPYSKYVTSFLSIVILYEGFPRLRMESIKEAPSDLLTPSCHSSVSLTTSHSYLCRSETFVQR